jgi:hypothetical protein
MRILSPHTPDEAAAVAVTFKLTCKGNRPKDGLIIEPTKKES